MNDEKTERLQKFLARAGFGSRRECEKIIQNGLVLVNGKVVSTLGTKINPVSDHVVCEGKKIRPDRSRTVLVMLHKPKSCVTTRSDPENRSTIYSFIPEMYRNLSHVGRLDYDAEGLLLLTNDGDLANTLMKPGSSVMKTYEVKVKGQPDETKIKKLREGVYIGKRKTRKAQIAFLRYSRKNTWYRVHISEGKNRQIKKMFEHIRHPVLKIKRTAYGPLNLGDLAPGKWRLLSAREVNLLKSSL